MSTYSVVVPVYNSEHTLEALHARLCAVFDEVLCEPFELILVDDSSKDGSYALMQQLHKKDSRVHIIQLSRNFGQPGAILCGFSRASGDFVITMDDDLQHRPESLPDMIRVLKENDDVDVVLASYQNRKHNAFRRLGTRAAQIATSHMMGTPKDLDMTSFRVMRRFVVDAVLKENVFHPQIGNLLIQVSNRIVNVPVQHDERAYGKSGYSYRRLIRDLIYDVTSHSAFPMILVRNIGITGMCVDVLLGLIYLIRYLVHGNTVEGWTSMVLIILMGFSLVFISLGIMGMYLLNILNQSKTLPQYIIRREEGQKKAKDTSPKGTGNKTQPNEPYSFRQK